MNRTTFITRKAANQAKKTNIPSKEKTPITISEKFADFEKKFEIAIGEVDQLKTELNLTKNHLADATIEIAETKKEMHAQVALCEQEIKNIKAELRDLKESISANNVNAEGNTAGAGDAVSIHRMVLKKLPCHNVAELKLFRKEISDLDTLTYIVSISYLATLAQYSIQFLNRKIDSV